MANKLARFYTFLLTLSSETKIAYALFEASDGTDADVDSTYALCMIIRRYYKVCLSNEEPEKSSLYYESVIVGLDEAISGPKAGRDPAAIITKQFFERLIKSIIPPIKL